MNKETFCPYPFDTIFLGADSGIKTCCSSRADLGNLNKDNIETILSSDTAQEVKQTILDGKWHPQCSQCKEIEDMGGRSERSVATDRSFERYQTINLDKNYFKLEKIDLRWTNTCNLACNYCYEYFSSKWSTIKGLKVNTLNEVNQESLFQLIEKSKDTITDINLLGGEPLLQKQNLRLVEILKDKKYYVLTNLAVPFSSNPIANKLLSEPNVDWGISFETIGKRFEYVRHNADWDVFNNNLSYVRSKAPDVTINAHPLYCTYSAFNLVEYYEYVLGNSAFNEIYWCVIRNIDGLNVFKLPKNLKELAIKEIEKCEERFPGASGIDHLTDIRKKLIDSLDDKYKVETDFNKFTAEIEKVLSNKEFSFNELWPEVSKLI